MGGGYRRLRLNSALRATTDKPHAWARKAAPESAHLRQAPAHRSAWIPADGLAHRDHPLRLRPQALLRSAPAEHVSRPAGADRTEIGRASCRERVETTGAAAAGEENKEVGTWPACPQQGN